MGNGPVKLPLLDRARQLSTPASNGCRLWIGTTSHDGQPRIAEGNGNMRMVSARRAIYQAMHGPLDPGDTVTTSCGSSACVEPLHLQVVPNGDYAEERRPRGERVHTAVLNEDDVRAIRRSGDTLKELAESFGISVSNVHAIRSRQTWRHI